MVKIKIRAVDKSYRYEIAETSDGEVYLVDMGLPVISWLFWVFHYIIPKRCYPISNETAKIIAAKRKASNVSPSLVGGIGVIVSFFVFHTNEIFSVSWDGKIKVVMFTLILLGFITVRLYFLEKAKKDAIYAGAIIEPNTLHHIRFKPTELKLIVLVTAVMILLFASLFTLAFFIFEPTVNVFMIVAFCFFLYADSILSSRMLPLEKPFITRIHKQ